MPQYRPTHPVTTLAEITDRYRPPHPDQLAKIIDHLDPMIANWLAATTFAVLATTRADGTVDLSPKGDPAGFLKVIDRQTLALPDRPGNHRFDSFRNILDTGQAGLICLVPNRNEVVRINGTAQIIRDPDIRAGLAIKGRTPDLAILLHVREAFFHCGKAIIRSHLWQPQPPAPNTLPTYAEALIAQTAPAAPQDLTTRLENNDKNRLYDE